jgi:2,5-dioxopentanoate dehydrogenase
MLTPGIARTYERGVEQLASHPRVATIARGQGGTGVNLGRSALFATDAQSFLADEALKQEVFGASSLLIRCRDLNTMRELVEHMEGQLTITLQLDEADLPDARTLMPTLERKAGRLLVNAFPTGVEVAHAMVHGGPFPATSDGRSTSVGSLAIRRFLRPVCYQDFPSSLLPEVLSEGNLARIPRQVEGRSVM